MFFVVVVVFFNLVSNALDVRKNYDGFMDIYTFIQNTSVPEIMGRNGLQWTDSRR